MFDVKPGILMGRLQMIKTEEDKDFRFGKVFLVKKHWFGKKMIALDATEENDEYLPIVEMKLFKEEDGKYHEIDVNNIICKSMMKGEIFFGKKEACEL